MQVLIVENVAELAALWKRHLERDGAVVGVAGNSDEAIALISEIEFDVIIISLGLGEGDSAMAVTDYAQYRRPDARLLLVSDGEFFSDGSIFEVMGNARALIPRGTGPEDIAALVEHYGAVR